MKHVIDKTERYVKRHLHELCAEILARSTSEAETSTPTPRLRTASILLINGGVATTFHLASNIVVSMVHTQALRFVVKEST